MAFKKVLTLDTDSVITIGGVDSKTGKANPKSIEGYFLGTKALGPNKFNKSKTDYMHIIQTQNGNTGVWGKTHMDRQLLSVPPGTLVLIQDNGTKDVGKGNDMRCYIVKFDDSDVIDVAGLHQATAPEDAGAEVYDDGAGDEDEESVVDELPPARATPPARAAQVPSAAAQAKTRALLGGRNRA